MDIYDFLGRLIDDYAGYTRSFLAVREPRLRGFVEDQLAAGVLWPEPLIQLNPSFEPGKGIDDLVAAGVLHPKCRHVFRAKSEGDPQGRPLKLHRHQSEAIRVTLLPSSSRSSRPRPGLGKRTCAHCGGRTSRIAARCSI